MKKGTPHHNALGIIGLLIVAIGFVLFYKLFTNQAAFADDLGALRNYVILSILVMGFLTFLFYLASKPHNQKAPKAVKSSKATKKKKSR